MGAQGVEEIQEAQDLLERLELEPRLGGGAFELGQVELHCGSSQRRCRTYSGTTRFQRASSFPDSRRVSR